MANKWRRNGEEHVQVPVGDRLVAPYRACVAAAERRQHHASWIEIEHGGKIRNVAGLVAHPLRIHRNPEVTSIAATHRMPSCIGVRPASAARRTDQSTKPEHEHERHEQAGWQAVDSHKVRMVRSHIALRTTVR
jgi:hypothetical protein